MSGSAPKKKVEYDLHELVGQVLNERLRVVQLSYVSARQWLYEVEPPSVGKTRRALKVLGHPSGREPGSFYRLKTSMDRLRGLQCPQLEEVYEVGVLHDLSPYVLSEWEPHPSLYELLRLRKGPLKWFEAQTILIDVCRGLKALHSKGVTHGDLRAQHVLLRQPCSDALLIDFAVSGAFGAPPATGLERSLAYWAPERLTFAAATPSTDIYSFGVLAYLCLEGKLPFIPNSPEPQAPIDPLLKLSEMHHSTQAPPMTSDAPQVIQLLIAQMLSKDPYLRPATASLILSILIDPEGGSLSENEADHHAQEALDQDPWDEALALEEAPVLPMLIEELPTTSSTSKLTLMICAVLAAPLALLFHHFLL